MKQKKIYVVIEVGHFDAVAQGAYETEVEAWNAINALKDRGFNTLYIVRPTYLFNEE